MGAQRLALGPGIAALLLAGATGCAMKVHSDFDHDAVFSYYETYDWLAPPIRESEESPLDEEGPFERNSLLDKRVRTAVDKHLAARGFKRVEGGEPDFRVNYHVRFKDKFYASGSDFGYMSRYYRGGFDSGFNYSVRQYQQGTLIIDIVDRAKDQLVWRGWATSRSAAGNFDEAQINEAVPRILLRFPPGHRH